ncbi:hypothetical protein ACLVWU_11675 [Bdellovibrio sp. HCB290]|uniref:hypothetical protein n=1 Tax=Bdellovibrio sp. HCB290 TaxID=3394356 RepID=UPI0039B6089A
MKFQEFVGTTIHWAPNNRNYILTVAHGVVGSSRVIARCNNQAIEMRVVGLDTNRDIALLEPLSKSSVSFAPFFKLPQGPHAAAVRRVQPLLRERNTTNPNSFSDNPASRRSSYLETAYGSDKKDIDTYEHLALMHPFFKNTEFAKKRIEGPFFKWAPLVRKDLGIYELQQADFINQILLSKNVTAGMQNPFYQFNPHFLTIGVRPGMSGSPVFEYLDKDVSTYNNLLTGMVSKTKSFRKLSLLIPSETIEQGIVEILSKQAPPSEHLDYKYDPNTGRLFPYFTSKKLGLSFRNACDGDYANTSTLDDASSESTQEIVKKYIKKDKIESLSGSRGGDWGDGGGTIKDSRNYIYSPFFTDSRHVPTSTCTRTGVTDNNGITYVAYIVEGKVLPLRNLDQLMNYIRVSASKKKSKLISESALENVKKAVCSDYIKNPQSAWFSLIQQVTESQIKKWNDGVRMPRGIIFNQGSLLTNNIQLSCDQSNQMSFSLSTPLLRTSGKSFLAMKVKDLRETSEVELEVGSCKFSASGKNYGFERVYRHPLADIRMVYELPSTWSVNITSIDKSCNVGTTDFKKAAIHFDFDLDTPETEKTRSFLMGLGI